MEDPKPREPKFYYSIFKRYVNFINSRFYYRHIHAVGIENMPKDGTPVVLVSNHQNCLNDPLALALMLNDRRPNFLARANVFQNPVANRFLRYLGLLPAYRVKFDGFSAVNKNKDTLDAVDVALRHGETVILYPECGHQDKRWLGNFSQAYLKMAFGAAAASNFEQEVFVMPTANHYSDYYHARSDMMIKFGKPISIKPYYQLYQKAPRQAMRQVNEVVRAQIEELMLNIRDLDNYDDIDFLRESSYGKTFARQKGFSPDKLPEKLLADKELVSELECVRQNNPDDYRAICEKTHSLRQGLAELGVRDWLFESNCNRRAQVWHGILLVLGLPLFVASIIPTALMFIAPNIFIKKFIKDQMFRSSINIGLTVLVTYPVCCIIPTIVLWFTVGWLWALIYFCAFPLLLYYAWNYMCYLIKYIGEYRFLSKRNRRKVELLTSLREGLFEKLDAMLLRTAEYRKIVDSTESGECASCHATAGK